MTHLHLFVIALFFNSLQALPCDLPPPFEKIYVTPYDILSLPEGTFYRSPTGELEPIRLCRSDSEGTYIIKITQYCPICGQSFMTKNPPEGYDCPVSQIEVLPHIWTNH